tara:strand:- start:5479 stop:6183 length:705 start_codon:yes stop_codon:yes gene_type:complete
MAKKIAVKKKVRKKKVAKSAPPGSVAAAGEPKPPKPPAMPGEGFGIGGVIMFLITAALLGFVVFIFLPRDLSHVGGYPYSDSKAPNPPKNLLKIAEDQLVKDEGSVSFSEEEVNTYLNQRLNAKQRGAFGSFVKMNGVYLDFKKNEATIFVERKVFGLPFTIASSWDYYLSDGKYVRECKSSSVGRFSFSGAMFRPIMAPFFRIAQACTREQAVLSDEDVTRVKIDEGNLTIEF